MDLQLPEKMLSTRGLNTLMFSDPYAKLCFTVQLASEYDKVTYIDLDTTFAAYFNAGLVQPGSVDVYLPSEGRLVPMIKDALESMGRSELVIFDSVNSFYNLFPVQETGDLNHLLSVLLMLLVRRGVARLDQGRGRERRQRRVLLHRLEGGQPVVVAHPAVRGRGRC